MAELGIHLQTGGDDLRGGSWAHFVVKLAGQNPVTFEKFTPDGGLPNSSSFDTRVSIPMLTDPNAIEFFQIVHVSQEGPGQTADNWNLDHAIVTMAVGRFPVQVGEARAWRFDGAHRILTFYPPQA